MPYDEEASSSSAGDNAENALDTDRSLTRRGGKGKFPKRGRGRLAKRKNKKRSRRRGVRY